MLLGLLTNGENGEINRFILDIFLYIVLKR